MSQLPKIVRLRLGQMAAGKFAGHPDANLLAAFAERSLSKTERAMVMDHLGMCAECRECLAVAFVPAGNVSGAGEVGSGTVLIWWQCLTAWLRSDKRAVRIPLATAASAAVLGCVSAVWQFGYGLRPWNLSQVSSSTKVHPAIGTAQPGARAGVDGRRATGTDSKAGFRPASAEQPQERSPDVTWRLSDSATKALAELTPPVQARELFYGPPYTQPRKAPRQNSETPTRAFPPTSLDGTDSAHRFPRSSDGAEILLDRLGRLDASGPLGLRYSVQKLDTTGKSVEVDRDSSFQPGDRIRLEIEANTTSYLYVVTKGSSGSWKVLFPNPDVDAGSNLIQRGELRLIPTSGDFVFDEQPGTEKLFLLLARQPQPELDHLIYVVANPANSSRSILPSTLISDDVVERLRRQKSPGDIVVQAVNGVGTTGRAETAVYEVNLNWTADALLEVPIDLKHGASPGPFGTIVLSADMDGVEVVIDGKSMVTVSKGKPVPLPGLSPGVHSVEGRKMGYEPIGPFNVTVSADREISYLLTNTGLRPVAFREMVPISPHATK